MLHLCINLYKMKYLNVSFVILIFTFNGLESQNKILNTVTFNPAVDFVKYTKYDATFTSKIIRSKREYQVNSFKREKESIEDLKTVKPKPAYNQLTTILSVALITILFLLLFSLYKLHYDKLRLRNELMTYKQKALYLQMNPHFIFNCLGAVSGFMINNETDRGVKYLAKFSKLMRLTLEYSQESLIPIEKEIESLQNYLELEALRFDDKFYFTIKKSQDIDDDIMIPPLLIQPLIENAINHGIIPQEKKGIIEVSFTLGDKNKIICKIQDNGIGINNSIENKKEYVNVHKSMAISIIKKRLEVIARKTKSIAKLETNQINDEFKNSKGTIVTVILPIQYTS